MTDDTQQYEFHDVRSLETISQRPELQADTKPLFTITKDSETEYGLVNDNAGATMKAERLEEHQAVYNPESGRIFQTCTDDYEVINPPEFIGPLADQLRERERTDISGTVWVRNGGANAYGQLLFDTDEYAIWPSDGGREHPVRAGFNMRWSHDQGMSVKCEGFAQDGACENTIRQVTSSIYVKHAGDVSGRVDWEAEWTTVLDEMGAFSNALASIIDEALSFDMFDLSTDNSEFGDWREATEPLDTIEEVNPIGPITERQRDALYGFYELQGFPKYIGVSAVSRLMYRLAHKDDPRVVTAWDVHSGLTYALSHALRGTPGASDDDYHRRASEILMNPQKAKQDATMEARSRLTPDAGQDVLAAGDELADETGDALRQYSERARQLEATFGGE